MGAGLLARLEVLAAIPKPDVTVGMRALGLETLRAR